MITTTSLVSLITMAAVILVPIIIKLILDRVKNKF